MILQTELAIVTMFRQQIEDLQRLHREHERTITQRIELGDVVQPGGYGATVVDDTLVITEPDTIAEHAANAETAPITLAIDMHAQECDHGGVDGEKT